MLPEGLETEGLSVENSTATVKKDEKEITCRKSNKLHNEGTENYELSSFKNPKSWKKSISGFFRNQLRSSKSNDGDNPCGSKSHFDEKVTMEQKWQSLGKMFRRQSFVDHNPHTERESNSQNRFAIRSVLSSYFGKHRVTENASED